MPDTFYKLPARPLAADTTVFRYRQGLPASVTMHDGALNVMTDLTHVKVYTVSPTTPIDEALQKMIHAEVRLLIVTNPLDVIIGVITTTDISGELPVTVSTREGILHEEIRVEQIMTPRDRMDALWMKDVRRARVGDIVATLREFGRQHAIVLDKDEDGHGEILRGIFSMTRIVQQLGIPIESDGKMQSFADLERALSLI